MSNVTKFIDNRKFHKSNYSDVIKFVIPSLYYEEDYSLKQQEIDILDQVINSHLYIIDNFNSLISISAVENTLYSSIDTPEGISTFFVKQNGLTDIDINDFERTILRPLNKSVKDFNFSAEFSDFIKEDILPYIRLNNPTLDFLNGGTASENHNYLITNLSWLYFLNLSGPANLQYNPSSYVHDLLVHKLYIGEKVNTNDGIKGLTEFVWKNYTTQSWSSLDIIPEEFKPTQGMTNSQFTSGTQQLEKLKTLVDVLYSPLYIDDGDYRVKNAIDDYLQNQFLLDKKYLQGPFIKLIKAFSFAFADYSNQVDQLESLYDLDECPDEYLPLLADLIGWRLFGSEPDRWRLQLANAVNIYRSVGTKKSIQFVADSVFSKDVFDASSKINELWESYIPFILEYSLATESLILKDTETWTPLLSQQLGVLTYSSSSMGDNIKLCVDKIISDTVFKFPLQFLLAGKPFPLSSPDFIFNYRNCENRVPPYEEIPYYTKVNVTEEMVEYMGDKLICFGVPEEFSDKVVSYIKSFMFDKENDYSLRNTWLFFTPSAEYPPNWDSVIKDITNSRVDYLPMWNGKSSFFQVIFDASSFDFEKTSLQADSREILYTIARAIQDFSPAKSIPDVIARLSAEDESPVGTDVRFPNLNIPKTDFAKVNYSSGAAITGYATSALLMGSYKRGFTTTSLPTFSRGNVDSIVDSLRNPYGTIANLPRRNHRRRDLKFILPKEGYYDRTGFNMPSPMHNYITSGYLSGTFLPLGLVPSSMQFVPITDYNNIPAIYSKCEDLNSSSIYSGLIVSNTFPVRGWVPR